MDGPIGTRHGRAAKLVALACFVGTLTSASPSRAGDDDSLAELLDEHVVSGASKTTELAKDAPATTFVITSEEISRYGIRSLAEAIDFLGMGLVTQDPLHSVEVGGRGVLLTSDFGNHILLVVDGHVFNELWNGTAYFEQAAGIPLEIIDHIELILGPGSVLYGSNAMIGVINVVTKRAAANEGLHLTVAGGASPQQGRTGNLTSFAPGDLGGYYRLGASLGQKLPFGQHAEINVAAEVYHQSGPTFLWGPQTFENADGQPYNFGPRVPPGQWGGRVTDQYNTFIPSIYSRLQIGDLSVMLRAELYRRSTPVQGFDQQQTDFDEPRSWERDRWISADVQYEKRFARKLVMSIRGYADIYDYYQQTYNSEQTVCAVPTTGPCLFKVNGRSRWVGSELQASYDWTEEDRYTTLVGLNGTIRGVGGESVSEEADTGQVVDVEGGKDVTEVVRSAYIQQRIAPTEFLHLNLGARYDADPRGGNYVSPRAAVAVDVWDGGVLKLIYAEAFRAPTYFEALYTSPYQIANENIRSESVRGIESSFEQRFGRNTFLIGAFRTRWSDMLSIQTLESGLSQYQNISAVDSYGLNANVRGSFASFQYGASIVAAHTKRESPEGDQPLPAAPQLFGNARLSYSLPDALPTIALATTFVGRRPADRYLDGNFAPPPHAPGSAQLRLTLSQEVPGVPGLSYRVGGSYTTGDVVPYVAGPIQYYDANAPVRGPAELTHTIKLVGFATLRYDFSL
jgi:outer membrane receptor for ferrienterochelin and colicins